MDLAETLLTYDPGQRATANQALEASYFTQEDPPPEPPVGYVFCQKILHRNILMSLGRLSTLEGEWHELETKRERAKKRRRTEQ